MRHTAMAAAVAALTIVLAGCGGARPVPAASPESTPAPTAAPTVAPTAVPTPAPTAVPTARPASPPPVAVSQLERSVPPVIVPAPARTPAPVRRATPPPVPAPTPAAPQPPVIIRSSTPPTSAQPAKVVSDNWSGYAATGGGLWQVSASWVEPSATCTSAEAESVFWVGLGGYPSYPLYQAGSGAFCRNGVPIHALWYELITPTDTAPLVALVQIQPGDTVSASVNLHTGTVQLADATTGFDQTVSFTPESTSLDTAEWIAEATSESGDVSTLADFGSVGFASCSVNEEGSGLDSWPTTDLTQLVLTDKSGGDATPSGVSASPQGGGFTVAYSASP